MDKCFIKCPEQSQLINRWNILILLAYDQYDLAAHTQNKCLFTAGKQAI